MSEERTPTLAHRAEFGALRAVIAAMRGLSTARAAAFGARLGAFGYRPLGIRRRVVERQIAAAFPERSEAEVRRIARAAYRNLGRSFIETLRASELGREAVLELFDEPLGWHLVEEAMARGRGLIFATGHLGNWELGGSYIAARGVPFDAIVRRQGNPLFDRYIVETRRRIGMNVVYDADAVRRVPRSFREGRAVAFVSDQGVKGIASTFVPFFGRPAKTPRGPAVFALRFDIPVVFAVAVRQPNDRYRLLCETIDVVDTGDREADVDAIVLRFTQALERRVREYPEQYFWHHRRWRRQPEGTPPELREPV